MFKKLKERKELETKTDPNQQKSDEFSDNLVDNGFNASTTTAPEVSVPVLNRTTINSSFDYLSDDSIVDNKDVNNCVLINETIINTNSSNKCDESSRKTAIDLLNEQILKLNNDLVLCTTNGQSLESRVASLEIENRLLNQQLMAKTEECRHFRNQLLEYQSMNGEKDDLLLRNAELSSKCKQLAQELESEQQDRQELSKKCDTIETQRELHTNNDKQLAKLNETVVKLEQTLTDKNKTIKLQQQRLLDMKKTFLQNQSNAKGIVYMDETGNTSSGDERSPIRHTLARDQSLINENSVLSHELNDSISGRELNFQYLRNVIFKYMISSDYEVAIHLVRAISVLLSFTKEEEQLIKSTIEWKMSWIAPLVASKPKLKK